MSDTPKRYWMSVVERDAPLPVSHEAQNGDPDFATTLDRIKQEGRGVRILSASITSPTTAAVVADFLSGFTNGRHVVYDPVSASAVLDAHQETHGMRVMPQYHFDQADVIV